ncbi:MAG TPA: hypothetical protein ENJ19_02475 [Gammaproteobacteria bacterium]|nr:hypothetical protein [Gammaproteobacteria bacterium]
MLVLAAPGFAADSQGRFAVRNVGMLPCQKYLDAKANKDDSLGAFWAWMDGYISAANQFTPNTYDLAPWSGTVMLGAMLEGVCKKDPGQRFFLAVNHLAAATGVARLGEFSEMVVAEHKGEKTAVYKEVLKQVQTYLKSKGMYKGTPDGLYGPGTRKALEAYQRARGIKVTGLPEQVTLFSVMRDLAQASQGNAN